MKQIESIHYGAKLMKKLSQQLADSFYHKAPGDSFVCQVGADLAHAILLGGISLINER